MTRNHAVGYSRYYHGYVKQHYTADQVRSSNLLTLSTDEVSKPKSEISVNQSVDIRQNGEGLSQNSER